jgi:hypothetical protein
MRSGAENKPTHIVKGNIFDALGFSTSEASALKIKAEFCLSFWKTCGRKATHRLNSHRFWTNTNRR